MSADTAVFARHTDKKQGRLSDYLAIARLDHGTKHIFIVPGIVLAWILRGVHVAHPVRSMLLGFAAAVCIASANYVINEWLDREFDKHHPTKHKRAAVQAELRGSLVFIEWLALATAGLACAYAGSTTSLLVGLVFVSQGIFYNVAPLRTKDKAYLDVLSEAINNPLRLMLGWAMIDPGTLPPASIILMYWTGGAFLMAAKRLSEYREIVAAHGKDLLARYRASFAGYSEVSLTASCFSYALFSSFFLAVFFLKYRIEYTVTLPIIIALFTYYFVLATRPASTAQKPEQLFRERGLVALVALLTISFATLSLEDLPFLSTLSSQTYIQIR